VGRKGQGESEKRPPLRSKGNFKANAKTGQGTQSGQNNFRFPYRNTQRVDDARYAAD